MKVWNEVETKALVVRLLQEFDERLVDTPMDELVVVDSISVSWRELMGCLQDAVQHHHHLHCHELIERLGADNTPFMLFIHEFGILKNHLVKLSLERDALDEVRTIFALFDELEDEFAGVYLKHFIARLGLRNHLRLSHIQTLSEKNILVYFESHLVWIDQLIKAVEQRDPGNMPELDHTRCEFGNWLLEQAPQLIRDRSHIEQISSIHKSMHDVVNEVRARMQQPRANGPLYALLKKAETYSLELGNEISLLNSIIIMSVYNKDPLTGFLNRRFLDRVLINQMEIAKATETAFSLVMFDIDHFKKLNDKHGHQVGDRALEHVAAIVRETLRQSDLVFRYGGEEFLIILPSTHLESARGLAERLRQRLEEQPLAMGARLIPVTASFGVTEVAPSGYLVIDNSLLREVMAECDGRLYMAKHRGRNRVV